MHLVGSVFVVIALCLLLGIRAMASKFKETETARAANIGISVLSAFLVVSLFV